MDSRAFILFALLTLFGLTRATYTVSPLITLDEIQIYPSQLVVNLLTTNSDGSGSNYNIQISTCSLTSSSGGIYSTVGAPTVSACASPTALCKQTVAFTLHASSGCTYDGSFTLTCQVSDCTGSCSNTQNVDVTFLLDDRDACAQTQYTLDANITSFGTYADATWQTTKNQYFINDFVYFPFLITYEDLSITSVTFSSLSVGGVALYQSGSATAEGSAVGLQTYPVTTALGSNVQTAFASFSLQVSRDGVSPFAAVPAGLTTYTFNVVFNVQYKNSKRFVGEEGQLHGQASIVVNSKTLSSKPRSVTREVNDAAASAGSSVTATSALSLSLFLALFVKLMF